MNGGGSCQHHPDFYFGETKRLDLRRNQAFHNASGGDKRDRTADLLNAIDGRGSVRQGQALQKEKPLKCKGFLLICPFRALYFSASCALEFLNRLLVLRGWLQPHFFYPAIERVGLQA